MADAQANSKLSASPDTISQPDSKSDGDTVHQDSSDEQGTKTSGDKVSNVISSVMEQGSAALNLNEGEVVQQRKVIYDWTSPQRYYKPLDRKKYFIILASVILLMVVLAILGQYMFMAAIAAVMFLVYVIGTVPPVDSEHRITTLAVETMGGVYEWEKLRGYWYSRRDDQLILNVDTNLAVPGRLIMLVDEEQMKRSNEVLSRKLQYIDMPRQNRISEMVDGEWVNQVGGKRDENVTGKK